MKQLAPLALLLAATAAGAPSGSFDEDEPPPPRCTKCDSVGRQPCDEHDDDDCALETNAQYCSFFAGCEPCGGTGWVDCEKCENEAGEAWLAERRRTQAEHAASLATYDEQMDRALRKAKSEHFVIVWEIDKLKVDKRLRDAHEMLHLTIDRMERLYADYCAIFGATDREFAQDVVVLVWSLEQDQRQSSAAFCGNESANGVKLLGSSAVYSVCGSRQRFRGDEELHRNLVHSVAHLLLAHQEPSNWLGNRKGGWADAGVAHFFEMRYFGLCDNYCYQEVDSNRDFKGGDWKPAVRKMVALDDVPPIALVFEQNTDTLTLPQHAVSFSYVDYLIALDGAKAGRLFRRLREREETRDALRDVFEMNVLELEQRWKEWVLDTYPAR